MKKRTAILLITLMMVLLSGCSGASYVFSGSETRVKITATADDEKYGESSVFSVGKDREIVVSTDLSKGSLKMEFAEAFVFPETEDTPEDVVIGDVVHTITVTSDDSVTFELPQGDYIILVTAVGRTEGKVEVNVNKK